MNAFSDDRSGGDGPHPISRGEGDAIPPARYDIHILHALRRIVRGMDIHSQRLRLTHEITAPQLVCLVAIVTDGPISIKQIAARVSLSPSTVVGVLDRLEGKGLIMRLRDMRDRRVVNVTATPTGIQLVGQGPSPLHEGLATALKSLPEIEQAAIALSLQRIVDLMDTRSIGGPPDEHTGGR
ncbi:MAG TPA: MarR family transcriptional regulator [Candidatus Krumholzibacteria bacterium]|nr:MarR family transcriptional regulator [Candidatus Krumholzibacteria bacterium]